VACSDWAGAAYPVRQSLIIQTVRKRGASQATSPRFPASYCTADPVANVVDRFDAARGQSLTLLSRPCRPERAPTPSETYYRIPARHRAPVSSRDMSSSRLQAGAARAHRSRSAPSGVTRSYAAAWLGCSPGRKSYEALIQSPQSRVVKY
jgi:hypothetical protein